MEIGDKVRAGKHGRLSGFPNLYLFYAVETGELSFEAA